MKGYQIHENGYSELQELGGILLHLTSNEKKYMPVFSKASGKPTVSIEGYPSEDGEPREYWPMKLVASWAIQEIPSNWLAVVEGGPMEVLAASHSPGGRV